MNQNFPHDWDEKRVKELIAHYKSQTEDEELADIEAARKAEDITLSFEDYQRRRDNDPALVRCARCGKLILDSVVRCPECGVHFQGEAAEFLHPSEQVPRARRLSGWVVAIVVLLVLALMFAAVALP